MALVLYIRSTEQSMSLVLYVLSMIKCIHAQVKIPAKVCMLLGIATLQKILACENILNMCKFM